MTQNSWNSSNPAQVSKGGTGAATLTGVLTGNGTGAITAAAVTQYGVLVGDSSNGVASTAVGTATHVLTSNGAGVAPTFQASSSTGDVVGPASATDNALARFDSSTGKLLQDSTVIVTDDGEMTNGSQPAFLAYQPTNATNVTGAGTAYTIGSTVALTEVYDQNADFNTNGTFTAPVTGKYYLNMSTALFGNLGTPERLWIQTITSNATYRFFHCDYQDLLTSSGYAVISGSITCDMDSADTATFTVTLNDGSSGNSSGVRALTGSVRLSYLSGVLIC